MKKIALFPLLLVLCGCAGLPSASDVQHAFTKEHPDYKVREVLLSEQKTEGRYTAQFTIGYTKPSDPPKPVPPHYENGHMEAWYYHQEGDRWVAGKRETFY